MRRRNAQVAITDLFAAIFIFTGIIILLFITLNLYTQRLEQRIIYNDLLATAISVTDTLVKTPGSPETWELHNTTAQVIGLASSDRNISTAKVNAFVTLNYNVSKSILRIKRYDFKFHLETSDASTIIDYGINETGNMTITLRRIVWYGNDTAFLDFSIWS